MTQQTDFKPLAVLIINGSIKTLSEQLAGECTDGLTSDLNEASSARNDSLPGNPTILVLSSPALIDSCYNGLDCQSSDEANRVFF